MRIKAKKLKKGSLFKLILISFSVPFGLFAFVCGVAALLGAETVTLNNETLTGIQGLLAAALMYPLISLLFTAIMWLGAMFGLWMYSWFRKLELEFEEVEIIES